MTNPPLFKYLWEGYLALLNKRKFKSGFFTIESLVALTILGFIILFTTVGLVNYQKMLRFSKLSVKASIAATNALENLRSKNIESLQSQNMTISVGQDDYSVFVTVCPAGSLCRSQTKTLNLKVFHNNRLMYETTTIFTALK